MLVLSAAVGPSGATDPWRQSAGVYRISSGMLEPAFEEGELDTIFFVDRDTGNAFRAKAHWLRMNYAVPGVISFQRFRYEHNYNNLVPIEQAWVAKEAFYFFSEIACDGILLDKTNDAAAGLPTIHAEGMR